MTFDEAEIAAEVHRANKGDDVILHDPDDEGWGFAREDCGWVVAYDYDPRWD